MTRSTKRKTKRDETPGLFAGYKPEPDAYDEAFDAQGQPRRQVIRVLRLLDRLGPGEFRGRKKLADASLLQHGVTFAVYSDNRKGVERIFPFDLIPRLVVNRDWTRLERGLKQRIRALNAFLADIYGPGKILKDGVVAAEFVHSSKGYHKQLVGVRPPGGIFVHICGTDLIRAADGEFRVLEDNLRVPSGVSYVLENRAVMKRVYPRIFNQARVKPVDDYPVKLRKTLGSVAPRGRRRTPRVVVLTPGPHNSAYFEHTYLARRMGCELVQGADLFVRDDRVYVKTTRGPQRVDVIYRRLNDDFVDPKVFRSDSLLGVPGLVSAYASGNVTLANALGNGVADDKAIYPFVPDMIRYYLDEDPILRQVETYLCARDQDRAHVLANLDSMVVKAVDEAGGYGMLMGPSATRKQRSEFRERILANPRGYIAQPRIELSTCPTWTGNGIRPRRVDLRPFILTGTSSWVLPGGLTRVALREGSYVVNSSQGGGSKDTWVLERRSR